MATSINKLGERVDGWADLIVGAGQEADLARRQLELIIQRKNFPGTIIGSEMIRPSTGRKMRSYVIAEMDNGANVAAYFGAFGNDLYAKWDVYVKKHLNKYVMYPVFAYSGLQGLSLGSVSSMLVGSLGGGGWWAFILGFIFMSLVTFIPLVIFVGLLGSVFKQSFYGFIFNEMDEFDIDDMGALSLSIHKAMLDTLDAIGIETKALRIKESFAVGRRERLI